MIPPSNIVSREDGKEHSYNLLQFIVGMTHVESHKWRGEDFFHLILSMGSHNEKSRALSQTDSMKQGYVQHNKLSAKYKTPCNWKSNKPKTLQITEYHITNAKNILDDFLPFTSNKLFPGGRDSAVCIATFNGLDGPGIEFWWE
jgi:hypothetical protein